MYVLIRKRIIIINSTREILQVYKLDKQWKIRKISFLLFKVVWHLYADHTLRLQLPFRKAVH